MQHFRGFGSMNTQVVNETQGSKNFESRLYISDLSPFAALADFGLAAAPGLTARPTHRYSREQKITLALGLASAGLYLLLFEYQADLTQLAALTRQGHKIDAAVPIIVALVFSFIHGSFTGHLWDYLGLKPRKK